MSQVSLTGSDNLFHLLLLLAIAGVVVWLNNRFGTKGTRQALDKAANRSAEHLDALTKAADMAPARQSRPSLDRTIYPTSLTVRLIATALSFGMLIFLWRNPAFIGGPNNMLTAFTISSLLALWYLAYIWHYEVAVEGDKITLPTYWFKPRTFSLSDLLDVEDDGAYSNRLIFSSGHKPLVLKNLDGQAELQALYQRYQTPPHARASRG